MKTRVELRLEHGKLVLQPSSPQAPSLSGLLRGVRKSNLHPGVGTGPAQGKEVW